MDPLEENFGFGNTANDDQIDDNVTELAELTNATGTNLQNLNEDCLLKIFSNDSLTLMDLCSVAETCVRFKEITQRLFTKGFEIISRAVYEYPAEFSLPRRETVHSSINWCGISPVYSIRRGCGRNAPRMTRTENKFDFESQHSSHCGYLLQDVRRIFKNFGENLRTLKLLKEPDSSRLYHDSGFTLAGCQVNFNVGLSSILCYFVSFDLNSVFQPLLELSFDDCDLLRHSDFNGDSLTQLYIIECINYDAVLQRTFPSLKRFAWQHSGYGDMRKKNSECEDTSKENSVLNFIKRHGKLETISLSDKKIGNYVINVINSSCKKLEELTIRSIEQRNSPFSNLDSLAKTLKMLDLDMENETSDQYIPVIQAMKSLEAIRLRRMRAEDVALVPLFTALSQLRTLRKLHLTIEIDRVIMRYNSLKNDITHTTNKSCHLFFLTNYPLDRIPWSMLTRLRELHLSETREIINSEFLPNVVKHLINLEKFECLPHLSEIYSLSSADFLKIVKIVERREHVLTLKCYCNFNPTEHCEVDQKVRIILPD